jgi:hypothetical protein
MMSHFQVCERLVDSSMSHGVSMKMIVEAFNPTLPPHLRNLFKPTSSIQLPSQTSLSSSRPVTAAASAASLSLSSPDDTRALQERPFTANFRPSTSYGDAGDLRRAMRNLCDDHEKIFVFS